MRKTILFLLTTLLPGLTGCGQEPPAHGWQLARDGVVALHRAAPRGVVRLDGWFWAAAPWACAPELAVGPRGEAVVTSNVAPILWRVDRETLAVSVHPLELDADTDKDVGFSALVYLPERAAFLAVSTTDGALWQIDPDLKRARKLAPETAGNPFTGDTACATS